VADNDGALVVTVVDVRGNPLPQTVDIMLRHQQLSDSRVATGIATAPLPRIGGLHRSPQGLYRIEVDPLSYHAVSQFVDVASSGDTQLTLTCPVDVRKVKDVRFPTYAALPNALRSLLKASSTVLGFPSRSGKSLYDGLDPIRRAGLLNIAAKASATLLSNGTTVFPQLQSLRELRGDRFFAVVPKELREETKNSATAGMFTAEPSGLHHPPDGFTHAGSFKTNDRYGNLQLTFFMNGDQCVADIDIDDAKGFEHIFQVVHNAATGQPTHPYNIHEILLMHQRLDPQYEFVV